MKRLVVVASKNIRLGYRVKQAIQSKYKFAHVLPGDTKVVEADLVISTSEEIHEIDHPNVISLPPKLQNTTILSTIIERFRFSNINECIIGIDPGKSIGISIVYNGEILATSLVYQIEELIHWTKRQIAQINYDTLRIRIGNGAIKIKDKIIQRLFNEFDTSVIIEEVSEHNTSIKSNSEHSIHEEAAIRIAKRIGVIL